MKTITIQTGTDAPQIINIPDGAKVIIDDAEPEKYIPKVGDCVKRTTANGNIVYGVVKDNDFNLGCTVYPIDKEIYDQWFSFPCGKFKKITPAELQEEFNKLGYEYDFETHEARKLRWKPKNDEFYFYINASCQIEPTFWTNTEYDIAMYKIGNCYKTEEEAEQRRQHYLSFKD